MVWDIQRDMRNDLSLTSCETAGLEGLNDDLSFGYQHVTAS